MMRCFCFSVFFLGFTHFCSGRAHERSDVFLEPNSGTIPLSDCAVFVQTVDSDVNGELAVQMAERKVNVEAMMNAHSQIRRFSALHWKRDWDTIVSLFKALGMRSASPILKGKVANYANMLLALAWQEAFSKPCLINLEDDVRLPGDFEHRLAKHSIDPEGQKMFQFLSWAEGFVYSLGAAKAVRDNIYEVGIGSGQCAADTYIMGFLHPEKVDVGVTVLARNDIGGSNINFSPLLDEGFAEDSPIGAMLDVGFAEDSPIGASKIDFWHQLVKNSFTSQDESANKLVDLRKVAKAFVESRASVGGIQSYSLTKGDAHEPHRVFMKVSADA